MPTVPTSLVNRIMGSETWTDSVAFAAGTTIGGVPLDAATRLVATTGTTIAVSAAAHAGRILVLNSTATVSVTLPAATGTGNVYTIVVGTTGSTGSKIIQVGGATTDIIQGGSIASTTESTTLGFVTSATSDTVTLNNTTSGGLVGTTVTLIDIASGVFTVQVINLGTGHPATPFAALVP